MNLSVRVASEGGVSSPLGIGSYPGTGIQMVEDLSVGCALKSSVNRWVARESGAFQDSRCSKPATYASLRRPKAILGPPRRSLHDLLDVALFPLPA